MFQANCGVLYTLYFGMCCECFAKLPEKRTISNVGQFWRAELATLDIRVITTEGSRRAPGVGERDGGSVGQLCEDPSGWLQGRTVLAASSRPYTVVCTWTLDP